jgi:hypothetical protein
MGFLRLPFFAELEAARSVLVAGAGGGFDIFSGLPLYFGLRAAGVEAHLANLSFSRLTTTDAPRLAPVLFEVTAETKGSRGYFPERHLARWLREQGAEVPIYCFEQTGVRPLAEGYRALVERLGVDAVLLVDGGTDSLMRGDEAGLGTPQEDIASILAVEELDVPIKVLACLGFGIDTFHGICHAHFLEAVAELSREGAFLGAWSLTREMPEVERFQEAAAAVLEAMRHQPSVVTTSIVSALEGRFGNYHTTERTRGSTLFINPLMTFYWCFRLEPVAQRIMYRDAVRETTSYLELCARILQFRATCPNVKPWYRLPM